MLIISIWVKDILIFIGQPQIESDFAAKYVHVQIIATYINFHNVCQTKFLNNLGYTKVPMYTAIIISVLHPIWCYLLVGKEHANLEIVGTGISNTITQIIYFTFIQIYSANISDIK